MPKVTKIEPTIDIRTHLPKIAITKRKVAAYARVSTNSEEQATSYETQVDYYTRYIKSNPDWEYAGVYADDGITGTSTKSRIQFQDMIKDALDGKIDLILAKSISRFARNTVDTLVNIRILKEHSVEVFFEKENIWTFDEKGEVMLTIMSSLAQEESRSISENVTWGLRKRFEDGKYSVPFKQFLGYDKGENGELVINPEQAQTVRMIYRLFLDGLSPGMIAKRLMELGIKTPAQKAEWRWSTIKSILTNEKYKGAAVLQKTYVADFLTKEKRYNNGELTKYYIEDGHEAIISPADWDIVQSELSHRKNLGKSYSSNSILSSKLICEDCGSYYGSKVWHSNDPYRKIIYRCNKKYDNQFKCSTPTLTEEEVKEAFLKAYNKYIGNREQIIKDAILMCETLSDTQDLENKHEAKNKELVETGKLYKFLITKADQSDFREREQELYKKYQELSETVTKLSNKISGIKTRKHKLENYIEGLKNREFVSEWDNSLWISMIHHCIVHKDKTLTFVFRDETEITV